MPKKPKGKADAKELASPRAEEQLRSLPSPFQACSDVALQVAAVIDDVVDVGAAELYDAYLQRKCVVQTTTEVLDEMSGAIRAAFLGHDAPEKDAAMLWGQEPEPAASKTDTWARSVVPTRPRTRRGKTASSKDGDASQSTLSRSPSRRQSRAQHKRISADTKGGESFIIMSPTQEARKKNKDKKKSPKKKKKKKKKGGDAADAEKEPLDEEEEGVRALEEATRESFERVERLKAEQAAEDEAMLNNIEALKGKNYTYNTDGSLLMISRLSEDKKYPGALPVELVMDDSMAAQQTRGGMRNTAADADGRSSTRRGGRGKGKGKKKRKKKRGEGEGEDEDGPGFERDERIQPPLMGTIRLQPGVVLVEDGRQKKGPVQGDDPLHMSRANFKMHQEELENSFDEASMLESEASMAGIVLPESIAGASRAGSSRAGTAIGSMGVSIAATELPNLDPLADGATAAGSQAGGDGGLSIDDQLEEDPNRRLIDAPDWGDAGMGETTYIPAPRPNQKPDMEQMTLELGAAASIKKPRDRLFVKSIRETRRSPTHTARRPSSSASVKAGSPGTTNAARVLFSEDTKGAEPETTEVQAHVHGGIPVGDTLSSGKGKARGRLRHQFFEPQSGTLTMTPRAKKLLGKF